MATPECIAECNTILRLMKGDKWEPGHDGFYAAVLKGWTDEQCRAVVNHCANTMTFRPSRSELLAAAQSQDGRPGDEEAWAMLAWDEELTAVLTEEMAEAQGVAWRLYSDGDRIGARMAFKDAYNRLVGEARSTGKSAQWFVSQGADKEHRKAAVLSALEKGRINVAFAQKHLPPYTIDDAGKLIEAPDPNRLLPGNVPDDVRMKMAWLGKPMPGKSE